MSVIISSMTGERGNRWLIIGAAALALLTGVLIFAALSGRGGSSGPRTVAAGNARVLVANSAIPAGTRLTPELFRVAQYAAADVVSDPIGDTAAVAGQVTRVDLLKGQQLSKAQIGQVADDKRSDQLAFKIPAGQRAVALKISDTSAIGGLFVPGDRVDVVLSFTDKTSPTNDAQVQRVQTLFQNVLVLARAKQEVKSVVSIGADGQPIAQDPTKADIAQRPDKVDTATASNVTLALAPEDVQRLILAESQGEITLTLRSFGENQPTKMNDLTAPVAGR